jgi:acyl-CoA thioesterase
LNELETLRKICLDQPALQWIGIDVIDAGPGWARERLPFRPHFLQPSVMHGGAIYFLADTLTAHALLTKIYPDEWCTTVEQKINFLRGVKEGDITGVGRVVHFGKRIVYCEAEVFNAREELVAKSTATMMRLPRS